MFVGCFAVIPWFGGEGAALVRLFSFLAMCAMMIRLLKLDGSLKNMFTTVGKVTAASLLCGGVAYVFVSLFSSIAGVAIAIMLSTFVYIIALRLLNAVPHDDIVIMRQISSRLPRRAYPIAAHALDLLSPHGT